MLNIDEINNTIEELENASTTFDTCSKLASLYIVREFYKKPENRNGRENTADVNRDVVKELNDILPQYRQYCEIKRKYQLNELPQEPVIKEMKQVCQELQEFVQTLYSNTDLPEERHILVDTLLALSTKLIQ